MYVPSTSPLRPEDHDDLPADASILCDDATALAHGHETFHSRLDRPCGLRIAQVGAQIIVDLVFPQGRRERVVARAGATNGAFCDDPDARRTFLGNRTTETRRCHLTIGYADGWRLRMFDAGMTQWVTAGAACRLADHAA
jgi:hypothetical protein